ncbi:MAG: ethanolamine utilization protein EutN [Planctomycetaceae bacterium]|nr:MAG: ethanolamine utilization protein EutN [Planctomycetaceae bacterium]
MFLARVTGSVVATQKVESMVGQKLLVVEPLRVHEQQHDSLVGTGRTFIAVDTVGCGEGEVVLIVQGSSARFTPQTKPLPVDCAIIGIVDSVHIQGRMIFGARQQPTAAPTS